MKTSLSFATVLVLFFATTIPLFSQSSEESAGRAAEQAGKLREALTYYTTALQATSPGSEAEHRLFERAAAISSKVSPLPALPDEAERRFVRGQALVEGARDADAFMRAAAEFRAALRAAPWLADAHYNLGIVLDKAQRFSEAIRSLKLYILAAPNAKEAGEAQRLIYRIELRQEEAQRAKAEAERKAEQQRRRQEQETRASNPARLAGDWCFLQSGDVLCAPTRRIRISGSDFEIWYGRWVEFRGTVTGDDLVGSHSPYVLDGTGSTWDTTQLRSFRHCSDQPLPMRGRIAPGGNRIDISYTHVTSFDYQNCEIVRTQSQNLALVRRP